MAAPRDIVVRLNGSAEPRLDAEQRERASCHGLAHDGAHSARAIDLRDGERRRGDPAEDVGRALAQVLDVRVGHRVEPPVAFGLVDVDERLGVIERGLTKEHGVSHAEDRRVGADADGQ